jgi:hypothetical protein
MVRITSAGLLALVLATNSWAQTQQTNSTPIQNLLNPLLSTGTPVGTPLLMPIGSQFQQVGQQPGANVGTSPTTWRQDAIPPNGQVIDLKNSVAPVPLSSLPPALRSQQSPGFWDQVYNKWASVLGFSNPETPKSGYIPGMTRRAKERRERRWIWD